MSNLDRKGGSWYAPLERPRTEKKKRRPKSTWLWIGLPVLVLLLIVGTSLAFAGTGSTSPGAMPSDWSDYLENFYQSSQSDTLETSIESGAVSSPSGAGIYFRIDSNKGARSLPAECGV